MKSPTNEQIAAVANWKQIATDIKDTAGVMVSFGKDTSVGG
ncbi:major capsid protein [Proteus mirabilis]